MATDEHSPGIVSSPPTKPQTHIYETGNGPATKIPSTIKRHMFRTAKANAGFWLSNFAQLCIFMAYNIIANMASTIHGDVAMGPMATLYALYIISSFLSPILIAMFHGQTPRLVAVCALGYCLFSISNIYARIYTLMIGAIFVGCSAALWSASSVTTSKLSLYISERLLLQAIQRGEYMTPQDEQSDHPIKQITNPTDPIQLDWYLSTLIDKNNRLLPHKLSTIQTDAFNKQSAAQLGSFNIISWLTMQGSSIFGSLIAFGILHIRVGKDVANVFESDTTSVRIMYGVFSFLACVGFILYLFAIKIIPQRVFFPSNTLSKWDLYLRQEYNQQQQENNDDNNIINEESIDDAVIDIIENDQINQLPSISGSPQSNMNDNDTTPSQMIPINEPEIEMSEIENITQEQQNTNYNSNMTPTNQHKSRRFDSQTTMHSLIHNYSPEHPLYIQNRHLFPGRATNDRNNDAGQYIQPEILPLLKSSVIITLRLARDPAITILLFSFFTAYAPLSFTLSAFSAKGGVKDILGVIYVPIFICIVAVADVIASFILKGFLTSLKIARWVTVIGLTIQLLSVVLMYTFPSSEYWTTMSSSWQYIISIAILQGIGDALGVSGLSTIISVLCRSHARLLASGFSLLMTGRGLGLCLMFALTSVTNKDTFRTIFWPIMTAMISISIIVHIIAIITDWSVDVENVLQISKPVAVEQLPNRIKDQPIDLNEDDEIDKPRQSSSIGKVVRGESNSNLNDTIQPSNIPTTTKV